MQVDVRDTGSILCSGRSPGGGQDTPLQSLLSIKKHAAQPMPSGQEEAAGICVCVCWAGREVGGVCYVGMCVCVCVCVCVLGRAGNGVVSAMCIVILERKKVPNPALMGVHGSDPDLKGGRQNTLFNWGCLCLFTSTPDVAFTLVPPKATCLPRFPD